VLKVGWRHVGDHIYTWHFHWGQWGTGSWFWSRVMVSDRLSMGSKALEKIHFKLYLKSVSSRGRLVPKWPRNMKVSGYYTTRTSYWIRIRGNNARVCDASVAYSKFSVERDTCSSVRSKFPSERRQRMKLHPASSQYAFSKHIRAGSSVGNSRGDQVFDSQTPGTCSWLFRFAVPSVTNPRRRFRGVLLQSPRARCGDRSVHIKLENDA